MTEKDVQDALYFFRRRQHHRFIVPNAVMRWGEVDLLSISEKGFAVEHEIKVTRSDFKADAAKIEKHLFLSGAAQTRLKTGSRDAARCPNYFIYCVPQDLIKPEEVPDYAGLIYVPERGECEVIRRAPRLHDEQIAAPVLLTLASKIVSRYWTQRIETNKCQREKI